MAVTPRSRSVRATSTEAKKAGTTASKPADTSPKASAAKRSPARKKAPVTQPTPEVVDTQAKAAPQEASAERQSATGTTSHASAFEQMMSSFQLPGFDQSKWTAPWAEQWSKLQGGLPGMKELPGFNADLLAPMKQAMDSLGQSMQASLSSMAGLSVPSEQLQAIQQEYLQQATELWNAALQHPDQIKASDRRFAAPEWNSQPGSAFMASMYLLNSRTLQKLADQLQGNEKARQRVRFAVQQWADAASPSNFLAFNPEAIKKAVETKGESLQQGLQHLLHDIRQGHMSQTDESVFEVGKNVATTEGAVVFENPFFQLIEYKPLTAKVHETPFLFVPPCINKYYILDLQPDNSLVRYLLEQGHRVFMVSWVNADESLAKATWDDYIESGVIKAIDTTRDITGADQINALGFCVGGTLLASALATLAAKGRKPVASLTLLTTFLDFGDTGIMDVFVDEAMVRLREMTLGPSSPQGGGLMKGSELAATFSFLRANDLVWNYVVGNYLKGEMPPPFDLLYWNSDSTNLPGPMYTWYLRNTYLENNLCKPGAVTVCGEPLDLSLLDMPVFVYGSREDHIVPWQSAYASTQLLSGPVTFVLGASGHIAGVINPPAKKKRSHWVTGSSVRQLPATADAWMASASEQAGSWWPVWSAWLSEHAGGTVNAPRQLGSKSHPAMESAPGRYVLRKA